MSVDPKQLDKKIREIYPEIDKWGIKLDFEFDDETDAWLVKFTKGSDTLTTHLQRDDAEKCINGEQCVYFGVQVGRFVKNYCEGGDACGV